MLQYIIIIVIIRTWGMCDFLFYRELVVLLEKRQDKVHIMHIERYCMCTSYIIIFTQ